MTALPAFIFFVLALGAQLVYPSEPDFVAGNAREVASFYESGSGDILAGNAMYLVSTAALLAFAGVMYRVVRRGDHTLATVALGGAVAGATLMIAASTADTVAALRVEENGAIDPSVATVMWDLQMALFGLAAPTAFAVFVLAVATAALRTGVLPAWLGILSVPLGVALLIPPISWAAIIVFIFWVPVAGGAVLAGTRAEAGAGAASREPLAAH